MVGGGVNGRCLQILADKMELKVEKIFNTNTCVHFIIVFLGHLFFFLYNDESLLPFVPVSNSPQCTVKTVRSIGVLLTGIWVR